MEHISVSAGLSLSSKHLDTSDGTLVWNAPIFNSGSPWSFFFVAGKASFPILLLFSFY